MVDAVVGADATVIAVAVVAEIVMAAVVVAMAAEVVAMAAVMAAVVVPGETARGEAPRPGVTAVVVGKAVLVGIEVPANLLSIRECPAGQCPRFLAARCRPRPPWAIMPPMRRAAEALECASS